MVKTCSKACHQLSVLWILDVSSHVQNPSVMALSQRPKVYVLDIQQYSKVNSLVLVRIVVILSCVVFVMVLGR